jgi:hypothetical protein
MVLSQELSICPDRCKGPGRMIAALCAWPGAQDLGYNPHPDGRRHVGIVSWPVFTDDGQPFLRDISVNASRWIQVLPGLGRRHQRAGWSHQLQQGPNNGFRPCYNPAKAAEGCVDGNGLPFLNATLSELFYQGLKR